MNIRSLTLSWSDAEREDLVKVYTYFQNEGMNINNSTRDLLVPKVIAENVDLTNNALMNELSSIKKYSEIGAVLTNKILPEVKVLLNTCVEMFNLNEANVNKWFTLLMTNRLHSLLAHKFTLRKNNSYVFNEDYLTNAEMVSGLVISLGVKNIKEVNQHKTSGGKLYDIIVSLNNIISQIDKNKESILDTM